MGDTKDESQQTGNANDSKKILIILGIVVAIVFLAMAGVIVYLLVSKNKDTASPAESAPEPQKREVLVTEENIEQVVEQMEQEEYVPQGYYTVTQNYVWHFPSAAEASTDAHVENRSTNTNDVYFDLFLADDDQNPIYQSPVIPLGAALEKFKLDTALEAGTYDCIMVYHLVDEDQNEISTVSMRVQVVVGG
jgi:hypothetical protein